jgi:pyruvate/2-oxoacid:ferredoxin oxidoreductase alpha subunit
MRKVIMGNHALSYGAHAGPGPGHRRLPHHPQTQVVELLSEMCADKRLDAKFIKVESEHSAMAACISASAAGARTFTATSAQGLALMHELLHWASGGRHPVVMGNINRSMAPGWSIWTDQNDSLSQRDTGWMQFYCSSNQEVLDTVIQAFKVSEASDDPGMVILDAFALSHTYEVVDIPEQDKVDAFCRRSTPNPPDAFRPPRLRRADRAGALFRASLQAPEGHGKGAGPDREDGAAGSRSSSAAAWDLSRNTSATTPSSSS